MSLSWIILYAGTVLAIVMAVNIRLKLSITRKCVCRISEEWNAKSGDHEASRKGDHPQGCQLAWRYVMYTEIVIHRKIASVSGS